jgi:hypothetical protein
MRSTPVLTMNELLKLGVEPRAAVLDRQTDLNVPL